MRRHGLKVVSPQSKSWLSLSLCMDALKAESLPTSTPRLGARLMTRFLAHCVRLSLVLGHAGVHRPIASSVLVTSRSLQALAYCTMSGRMGALKTFGRVRVSLLGAPSAPWMVTVGRLVILVVFERVP